MAEQFDYPPEVFNLLVDTIPMLCRSKQDVVLFLQGAGVASEDLAEVSRIVRTNRDAINKFEIVCKVLTKVNARGDSERSGPGNSDSRTSGSLAPANDCGSGHNRSKSMPRRTRRNLAPAFKGRVAPAALKSGKKMAELAPQ